MRALNHVIIFLSTLPAAPLAAIDVHDTRLLEQPALAGDDVAFAYAGDLWIAEGAASGEAVRARRLTSDVGQEAFPRFSPDGRRIAFSAEYDGNVDVFVVPAEGGVPRRLTWHPGDDVVLGFDPDGNVLFRSQRACHTRRFHQLFTVPVEGGFPNRLPIPSAYKADWSPDGAKIAYVPLREAFTQWKNYRGGTHSRIWIYDVADHSVVQVPQGDEGPNDTDPMWLGGKVYFLSDREGEFNLFVYDPSGGGVERLTRHEDFPIVAASSDGRRIVYEQAGYLHLFDPAAASAAKVTIGVSADLVETRPRYVSGFELLRNAHVSPTGSRAVLELRGEIVTLPAKKGDPRNITETPGTHERDPAWSPDGEWIAYFSDAGGEYELHVGDQAGGGEVRRYPLEGSGFYQDPAWSPDGEKISFTDNTRTLWWIDLESGDVTRVSQDVLNGPINNLRHTWSPDSRWLAYTRNNESNFEQIYLYELESGRSELVTDGLSDAGEPVFDASGKYLWFLASTDAGPVRAWFALSNFDVEISHGLYLAVLQKGVPSPLARESDEEETADEETEDEAKAEDERESEDGDRKQGAGVGETRVTVDFDGLGQRILAVPVASGPIRRLGVGAEGQVYYLRSDEAPRGLFGSPAAKLQRFDLAQREEETLAEGIFDYVLTGDHKKVLLGAGRSLSLADVKPKIDPGAGKLDVDAVKIHIEPRAEWRQIFDEAWRINRDFFYDPGMHGADWPAMREKYAPFVDHVTTRADLNRVIGWMCSELAVGHHRNAGGDRRNEAEEVPGGLLGADYEIHAGRYRFRKVYGGLNWNPDLRSPLTEPGVDVVAGEYLLAVADEELRPPENLYRRFEMTADKIVEITVGPDPEGEGARTVEVVPIADEGALRNRDWVEGNLRRVHEATGGRVAYVHVPDTSGSGHTYFKRYFFPQAHKDAIIVDERYNGGGLAADYYIDILRRPYFSHWAMRGGEDLKTPLASIQGPKVMLIDETAGSGGDYLPWMFRQLGLGTLVGKRTWGGLVGVFGFPPLMDGGFVTAPNFAIWTEDGFIIENEGVPPDVEVEQWPAEVIAGRDPQLERAIEIVLEELERNPPKEPRRPPYPVRVRR